MKLNSIRVFIVGLFACFPFAVTGTAKTSIEPASPKWGDPVRLIYNLDAKDAKIHTDDAVVINLAVWYPESVEEHTIQPHRIGSQLVAEWVVPESASYIGANFVTRDLTDGSISSMIWTRDGKEARGAWRNSMIHPYLQKDYAERAGKELALYPDYWAVYRDKWFVAPVFDRTTLQTMLATDIARIEREATGRPLGALYSLSYGYLLQGNEKAGRETIREMVGRFPDAELTSDAIDSYAYQAYSQHFVGDGPVEVRKWALEFFKRNPNVLVTRNSLFAGGSGDSLALETLESIYRQWIKDEPSDARPYMQLARVFNSQHIKTQEGLELAEKALDLTLSGESRMHGDSYGFLNKIIQSMYLTASKLALDARQYSKALAYAKFAETGGNDTLANGYSVEARIWEQLGRPSNQQIALKEAWRRGDQDAYAKLDGVYRAVHGSSDGFDKFLSGSDGLSKTTGNKRSAPSFKATSIDGQVIDSNQLKGKIIVANFWFTGCGPCKAEMPELNKLVAQFKGKEVVFLAFTLDEDAADLRKFLKDTPFQYIIVPKAGKIAEQFNVEAYPTHAIIGADGKLESLLMGAGDHRPDELRTVISRLLAEASANH